MVRNPLVINLFSMLRCFVEHFTYCKYETCALQKVAHNHNSTQYTPAFAGNYHICQFSPINTIMLMQVKGFR